MVSNYGPNDENILKLRSKINENSKMLINMIDIETEKLLTKLNQGELASKPETNMDLIDKLNKIKNDK